MAREVGVLFVCLGNICRSPTAEGVFRERVSRAGLSGRVLVDSAGTGAWHLGKAPDARAQAAAARRGYRLDDLRARQVIREDFRRFDFVLAMDRANLAALASLCPPAFSDRLALLLSLVPGVGVEEVPDPYYGGSEGFERVLDLVEAASDALVDRVRARLAT